MAEPRPDDPGPQDEGEGRGQLWASVSGGEGYERTVERKRSSWPRLSSCSWEAPDMAKPP